MKRFAKYLFIATVSIFIFGLTICHYYLPRLIIDIENPYTSQYIPSRSYSSFSSSESDKISWSSSEGLDLHGAITFTPTHEARGTIILVHGIRSKKERWKRITAWLADIGYNSVAIDLRAHGESEGEFCTYGGKEVNDISRLIDIINKDERLNQNLGIWGKSLGGSIAIQCLSRDKKLKFGIVESSYSDLSQIISSYIYQYSGYELSKMSNYFLDRAGSIGGFVPESVNPIDHCPNIVQPVLMLHGNDDNKINKKNAEMNFCRLRSKDKTLKLVKGANHYNMYYVGGEKLFDDISMFLNLHNSI